MRYKIEHYIGDKITIIELERPGIILAIYITETGTQYQVRYFYDGVAKTVYFYGFEIDKTVDSTKKP